MKTLSYALLFFCISIAVCFAILIRPDELDLTRFSLGVSWLIVLIIANWCISLFFFSISKNNNTTKFAILPSLHLITFIYSLASIGALLYFWRLVQFGSLPLLHWLLQLIFLGVYGLVAILILIASKAAQITLPQNVADKNDLLDKVKILLLNSSDFPYELREDLKTLEQVIRFSVPHPSAIKHIDRYIELTQKIFCLDSLTLVTPKEEYAIKDLIRLAKSC